MKKKIKKYIKIPFYIIGGFLIIVLGLAVVLWIKSPGKPDPITGLNGKTLPGSISTIEKIILGGQEQYLIIRGKDTTKPIMLFLHGGPGSPEIFLMKNNQAIENDFVMVYWEQLGAGKSYSGHIPDESINLKQFISDTKELSEYLRKRFGQDKIYIMGHSWGSFLGILTAYQYPELYHAYFGVGQVCHQYKGEQISFDWIKKQAKEQNNEKAYKAISEINFPDSLADAETWVDYLIRERNYVNQFRGGISREITGTWPVVKMIFNTKEYTFNEKINYMNGSLNSLKLLWPQVINHNLFNDIDSMEVPVYILQGKYDYQTPYSIAKDFYIQLKAPQKGFFTFENAAHSPMIEEVEKFNSIVREMAKIKK